MSDTLDLVGEWLNDVIAGPIPSAKVLNHTEQQEEIRRNVPFQPRTPITSVTLAQQEWDEERREREMELEAYTQAQNSAYLAGLNERNVKAGADPRRIPGTKEWYEANRQGPKGQYPGAMNNRATDYAQAVVGSNEAQRRLEEASFTNDPNFRQRI